MRYIFAIILVCNLAIPVSALEITAPKAPAAAEEYLDENTESFSEGLWYIIQKGITQILPNLVEASKTCLSILAVVILVSVLGAFSGASVKTLELVGSVCVGILLFQPAQVLVQLAAETIRQLSAYGKLLLPVMTAAMAAQGGAVTSSALNVGTAVFNAVLTGLISGIMLPALYIYMCLCVVDSILENTTIASVRKGSKWIVSWFLKIVIYVFTGYLSITGVVSGSVDASAMKATKLAISGCVPVVGNIISDASEAVLVSAGLVKNSIGVYGLLAFMGIYIGPFLQIGAQYVLLKATAAFCKSFTAKKTSKLVDDFSGAMGLLLGMTGTVCLLLLISTVCFIKGIA